MSCPDCFKGSIHDHAEPAGEIFTIHGIRTYTAGLQSNQSSSSSKSTIIFLTDAFGFNLVNSKLLADRYAKETGFRVLVPDIIPGGGVPVSTFKLMDIVTSPVKWWDIGGQIRRAVSLVKMMFVVIPFARRTRGVFPTILEYVRSVKADLPPGGKLGVTGICWGGMHSTKLSQEPSIDGGKDRLIDAHFTAHPAGVKPDDLVEGVRKFNVPFSMAVGDKDFVLKKEIVVSISAKMKEEFGDGSDDGGARYEIETDFYRGCGHGFAVRADPAKDIEVEGAEKAAEQAVRWFKKFL